MRNRSTVPESNIQLRHRTAPLHGGIKPLPHKRSRALYGWLSRRLTHGATPMLSSVNSKTDLRIPPIRRRDDSSRSPRNPMCTVGSRFFLLQNGTIHWRGSNLIKTSDSRRRDSGAVWAKSGDNREQRGCHSTWSVRLPSQPIKSVLSPLAFCGASGLFVADPPE